MDAFGIFYELPSMVYDGAVWGIKPISNHLRIVPDFVYWRGLFVMAGDQTDNAVGQPQSGLWFGQVDDLWNFGKPSGWGSVWREEEVEAGVPSDPFLMTGFDKKVLHLQNHSDQATDFILEIDYLGNGKWVKHQTIRVAGGTHQAHLFADGFSAHWVRLSLSGESKVTAHFIYN